MPFEDLPTTPDAEQLVDSAFSRAARAGRAKSGVEAQRAMLTVAGNVLSDNLDNVVREWPDFAGLHPYHRAIADAIADVDMIRSQLGSLTWASEQIDAIASSAHDRVGGSDASTAKKHRKQAFARMADVIDEIEEDLAGLEEARSALARLPGIDPDAPTIVLAGYPNVGKSSFLNAVTRARAEIDSYPFTTTAIEVGHLEHNHVTHQLVDTPGLLDRPAAERNEVEQQAIVALEHLADCVVVFIDASERCGYPLADQLALRDDLEARFEAAEIPVLTVCNKADHSRAVEADAYMSVTEDEGVEAVLTLALDGVGYEPTLPHERA